jgi:putative NIF3 family GTP cyclohydrolase 1 type 2
MDTDRLMAIALEMARQGEVPPDSQVYVPGREITKVLMGVDLGEAELLLAKQLGYGCAIAHHPAGGRATVDFHRILQKQFDFMVKAGVPKEVARRVSNEMKDRAEVRDHADNYDRTPAVARLLGLPFMSIHNPLDEVGRRVMDEVLRGHTKEGSLVLDAVNALGSIPELKKATTRIKVRLGSEENVLGRFVVHHGAGTNGGYAVAKAYFDAGVDTVVYIHIAPEELKRLREDMAIPAGKTLIITGHMASDSIGINAYARRLREEGLEVRAIGGIVEA